MESQLEISRVEDINKPRDVFRHLLLYEELFSTIFIMRSAYNTSVGRTNDQKAGAKPHRAPKALAKDQSLHTSDR